MGNNCDTCCLSKGYQKKYLRKKEEEDQSDFVKDPIHIDLRKPKFKIPKPKPSVQIEFLEQNKEKSTDE